MKRIFRTIATQFCNTQKILQNICISIVVEHPQFLGGWTKFDNAFTHPTIKRCQSKYGFLFCCGNLVKYLVRFRSVNDFSNVNIIIFLIPTSVNTKTSSQSFSPSNRPLKLQTHFFPFYVIS